MPRTRIARGSGERQLRVGTEPGRPRPGSLDRRTDDRAHRYIERCKALDAAPRPGRRRVDRLLLLLRRRGQPLRATRDAQAGPRPDDPRVGTAIRRARPSSSRSAAGPPPERVDGTVLTTQRRREPDSPGGPVFTIVVRDTEDFAVVGTIDTAALPRRGSGNNAYTVDRAGSRVAGTNSTGRTVVWSVSTGEATMLPDPQVQPTADVTLFGIDFSPDDRYLAVKSVDQVLRRVMTCPTGRC